jgi:hypothetical protein
MNDNAEEDVKYFFNPPRPGMKLLIRPWITNKATGRRVYPRSSRFFAFWVKA